MLVKATIESGIISMRLIFHTISTEKNAHFVHIDLCEKKHGLSIVTDKHEGCFLCDGNIKFAEILWSQRSDAKSSR